MSSSINPNIPSIQSLDNIIKQIEQVSSGKSARAKGLLKGRDVRLYLVGDKIQAMTTGEAEKEMKLDEALAAKSDSKRVKEINKKTISVLNQLVNPSHEKDNELSHKLEWLERKAEKKGAASKAIQTLLTQTITEENKEKIDEAFSGAKLLTNVEFDNFCKGHRRVEAIANLKNKSYKKDLPKVIISVMNDLGFDDGGRRDVKFFKNSEVTQHFIHKVQERAKELEGMLYLSTRGDLEVTPTLIQEFIKEVYGIVLKLPKEE